jgi:Asp-tRNA(Asn)/Glu-tRNA(Gln) amidotransferase A subunit family amidase
VLTRQARAPFNFTGGPALSVPTGFSESGLQLSMQIVGKPFSEELLYRVAHAYEQATDWCGSILLYTEKIMNLKKYFTYVTSAYSPSCPA